MVLVRQAEPARETEGGREVSVGPNRPRLSVIRAERSIELCDCIIDIAAAMFCLPSRELRQPGRNSAEVARVRQIAMYVCHVVLGLSMQDVGRGFRRDRTTVLHACHLVEDLRDDPDFEKLVSALERVAATIFKAKHLRA